MYVQRFPGRGGHRKVSEGGGVSPKCSSNGRQLLYAMPGRNRIMVVDYQGNGDAFVASKPRPWSPKPICLCVVDFWDVDPKGDRVVVAYLLHFFDELRRNVPVKE